MRRSGHRRGTAVGPRPERPRFAQVFADRLTRYPQRHRATAGLTGWAQVNGFVGNTSIRKRLRLDLDYIECWSPEFDVCVITLTLCRIVRRPQRKQFDFFSQALIKSIKSFGISDDTLYVQHCPMANNNNGADWISMEKVISNPYYGDKRWTCGGKQDTITKDFRLHQN